VRILVTGGSGLLGQAICRTIRAKGGYVAVYDLTAPEVADAYTRADVRDAWQLLAFAREESVDAVIHLAAVLTPESAANPSVAVAVNSGGMVNVCEAVRTLGVRRLVNGSSIGVLGSREEGRDFGNDDPYTPNTIYDATKVLNERIAAHYADQFGIETISLRYTAMVGPGKTTGNTGIVSRELIDKPVRGEPGALPWSTGGQNWLWVEDAAEVTYRAATVKRLAVRHLNVGGDVRPLSDAVLIVKELVPGAQITLGGGHRRGQNHVDMAAIKGELGFAPVWTLERQLTELVRVSRELVRGGQGD
jgi:UDP-glucose 4-epimerase